MPFFYSPDVRKWKIKENDDHSIFTVVSLADSSYNNKKIANYVCTYDSLKIVLFIMKLKDSFP